MGFPSDYLSRGRQAAPSKPDRFVLELETALMGSITRFIALEEAPAEAARILSGGGDGRAVVKLGG